MTSDFRDTSLLPEADPAGDAERLESLAALADGGLDAERRDEILKLLDADPESLDILAEVVAMQDEIAEISFEDVERAAPDADEADSDKGDSDETGDSDESIRHEPEDPGGELPDNVVKGPWGKQILPAVAALAAAAAALIVLAPRFMTPTAPTPQGMAAALSNVDASAFDDPPWSAMRGDGQGAAGLDPLSPRDSFRLGILAAELESSLRAGNKEWLSSLGPWLNQVLADSYLRSTYLSLADPEQPAEDSLALHAEVQESTLALVDTFWYRYGVWVRAAWLAASTGQLEFFAGDSVRSLAALAPTDDDVRGEIQALRAQIEDLDEKTDLEALAGSLQEIAERRAN